MHRDVQKKAAVLGLMHDPYVKWTRWQFTFFYAPDIHYFVGVGKRRERETPANVYDPTSSACPFDFASPPTVLAWNLILIKQM